MRNVVLLGDAVIEKKSFPHLDAVFQKLKREIRGEIDWKRTDQINLALLHLIQQAPEPCFLLPAVLEFIERVEKEKLASHYVFPSFELWFNQSSGLSAEENARIRAKIAGKWVDRSEYQILFPIGMGKVYEGAHYVTAHKSPDLDTTVASFWGWLDAFAARVSDGLHLWNLPGGPPGSQIEIDLIFRDILGPAVFTHLPKTRNALTLTGHELMTQKGLHFKLLRDPLSSVEPEREHNAVIIVDAEGFFIGDWRYIDAEGVRQIIILLSSCLRWFENHLHLRLITLFAKKHVAKKEVSPFLKELFGMKLSDCEPAREFTAQQRKEVHDFLAQILGAPKGLDSSFETFAECLAKKHLDHFVGLDDLLKAMEKDKLFDGKGQLVEERPRLFHYLEKVVRALHEVLFKIRSRLEQFDIALAIKHQIFGHQPHVVSIRSDVEEIRSKMGSYRYLTVAVPEEGGRFYPVGIVEAADIRKPMLGTVSLRDFCNRDEMGIPPYFDVISIIDHHKSSIQTYTPPLAIICDVQSANSLVADRAFQINDLYSLGGQTREQIDAELSRIDPKDRSPSALRLARRLMERKLCADRKGSYFIHPEREFIEYLHFLYAILDDTDLLSKVSIFDVEVVASLLNRLKSLSLKKETEIVHFDDLPRDKSFPKKAAQRLLQCEELYSLYRKVYQFREKEVERNIALSADRKPSNFFADTKEQNGCCRVGQTKIFATNVQLFSKRAPDLRRHWHHLAAEFHQGHPETDLHIHMISTIVSAEDVFKGRPGAHSHRDEMWLWIPPHEVAVEHLKQFLNAFQASPALKNNSLEVEFLGTNGPDLAQIFRESFLEIPFQFAKKTELPIAVLRYNTGSLNSRKAMVTPFLPNLG